MLIIRLIHIKVDPSETENAVRIWKTQCASLMIQQKGCLSEKLLRCRDAPEFISYSEWEGEAAIEVLSQQRRPQGDRAAHARTEKGEGGGQALRPGAIGPRSNHSPSYRLNSALRLLSEQLDIFDPERSPRASTGVDAPTSNSKSV